jgi:AcrR family transcriptional regulator
MAETPRTALDELEPDGLDQDGPRWQQRKSAQTRTAILEAAIDCLAKYGYSGMTTQLIAQVAAISRGAMLHHYATKQDLVSSLIDYAFYKRMEWFLAEISKLTEKQRVYDLAGIEVLWQSLLTRYYRAYLELSIAASADPDLGAIFLPKAQRYDRLWAGETLRIFPEWQNKGPAYDLARNFLAAFMEGIFLNRDIWDDETAQRDQRELARKVVRLIWTDELDKKKK